MYANTGYYDNQRVEEMYSDTDFFVHCCGHYRLIRRERFCTDRKNGAANYQLLYIACYACSQAAPFLFGYSNKPHILLLANRSLSLFEPLK